MLRNGNNIHSNSLVKTI